MILLIDDTERLRAIIGTKTYAVGPDPRRPHRVVFTMKNGETTTTDPVTFSVSGWDSFMTSFNAGEVCACEIDGVVHLLSMTDVVRIGFVPVASEADARSRGLMR